MTEKQEKEWKQYHWGREGQNNYWIFIIYKWWKTSGKWYLFHSFCCFFILMSSLTGNFSLFWTDAWLEREETKIHLSSVFILLAHVYLHIYFLMNWRVKTSLNKRANLLKDKQMGYSLNPSKLVSRNRRYIAICS